MGYPEVQSADRTGEAGGEEVTEGGGGGTKAGRRPQQSSRRWLSRHGRGAQVRRQMQAGHGSPVFSAVAVALGTGRAGPRASHAQPWTNDPTPRQRRRKAAKVNSRATSSVITDELVDLKEAENPSCHLMTCPEKGFHMVSPADPASSEPMRKGDNKNVGGGIRRRDLQSRKISQFSCDHCAVRCGHARGADD
jgi:hypothetical protein